MSFSANGIIFRIGDHPVLCQVPFKADIMTIFPLFAAKSENSRIYELK